jgi:hypothetical protein
MKGIYPKPQFIYLGEEVQDGSLILSNHEGTDAPLTLEMYLGKNVTMWGAHEMNEGVVKMYQYQTRVYYHQKKHWNLVLAKLFCLLASPLTYFFYNGLQLISIRDGASLNISIKETFKALVEFKETVIIFPEDSEEGYFKELKGFKKGFLLVCEYAYKKGYDIPVAVAYYKIDKNTALVSESIRYSELLEKYKTREKIAEVLKDRCNELGREDHTKFNK